MHSSRMRIDRLLTVCLLARGASKGLYIGGASGGCIQGGGCILSAPFPPVNRMTDVSENITFPALLRYAVGKYLQNFNTSII